MHTRPGTLPPFVLLLLGIDLFFAAMYVLFFGIGGKGVPVGWMFDVNREMTIPTWYSSIQLFLISAAFMLFVWREFQRDKSMRWLLWTLPAVFLAMSVDEVATLHEWLGKHLDKVLLPGGDRANSALFRGTGIWVVAVPVPFLLFLAFVYSRLRRCFAGLQREVKRFIAGLAIFILGAVVSEFIYNFIPWSGVEAFVQILSEELAEMVGATVMLWAVWDALLARGFSIRFAESAPISQPD